MLQCYELIYVIGQVYKWFYDLLASSNLSLLACQRHGFGVQSLYRQILQLYIELIQAYFVAPGGRDQRYLSSILASV